jgi:hypothetical protein
MKTILLKILPVLMSVFCTLHGVDKEYVISDNQKTYVDLSQISIIPEGVFVQLGNGWMAIEALYHDSFGYFFQCLRHGFVPDAGLKMGYSVWNARFVNIELEMKSINLNFGFISL